MSVIGYVTLAEADTYIVAHYAATNSLRVSWEALSDADKSTYLLRSFEAMEQLVLVGRKKSVGQTTAFPRDKESAVSDNTKGAQIENALVLSDSTLAEEVDFYDRLGSYGVESYSIGKLSESSSSGLWGKKRGNTTGGVLVSSRALELLQPYLRGGFRFE